MKLMKFGRLLTVVWSLGRRFKICTVMFSLTQKQLYFSHLSVDHQAVYR